MFLDETMWIDTCQTNSNLFAAVGDGPKVSIYDRSNSKIVKNFENLLGK